jgi:anti-sigma-K factor RskA
MVHDDYKEMIAAHALSALDAAEARALDEHLEGCAECSRDLAEWEAVAASLALSAAPVEPATQVRERIIERVRTEPQSPSNVVPLSRAQRNLWNSLGSLGKIAAVILFAALIVLVVVLWQQNRSLREQNELFQIVSSPRTTTKNLNGTAEAPSATARVIIDNEGHAVLITNGLPPPPRGKEYQLWIINPHQPPKPGKTFSTDSAGKGVVVQDRIGEVEHEYAVFAVTLEPAGGVKSPTGAMYLRSEL